MEPVRRSTELRVDWQSAGRRLAVLTAALGLLLALFAGDAAPLEWLASPPPSQTVHEALPVIAEDASALPAHASLGQLPLYFVENQGQMDKRVSYYALGSKTGVYFSADGVALVLTDREDKTTPPDRYAVKLAFVDANPDVRAVGRGRTEAVVSYFKGEPAEWKTALPTFQEVVYADVFSGVDLIFSSEADQLKYTFLVQPGADPGRIRLQYQGAGSVRVNEAGCLRVSTPLGALEDERPTAHQEIAGQIVEVKAAYDVGQHKHTYGFQVGPYDPSRPLVIDPAVMVYAGYIGGAGDDSAWGNAIAVDGWGNAYVTGGTSSDELSFPGGDGFGTLPGPDTTYNGGSKDAFVVKVKANGSGLVYAGYFGGSGLDIAEAIAVDDAGNAYVTGRTSGLGVLTGPDTTYNGASDAFVIKVNADGSDLAYAGYIGGSGDDQGHGVAVDGLGNAYVTGETRSTAGTFPDGDGIGTLPGPDTTYNGGIMDAFVVKVKADGSGLDYAGYLGGGGYEYGTHIAVDSRGSAYVTGHTDSSETTFPDGDGFGTVTGPDRTHNGDDDAFVAKIKADGTGLQYAGYVGGAGHEWGMGIAVDSSDRAYVTGYTDSNETTFPDGDGFGTLTGPDTTYNSPYQDAFVVRVKTDGSGLDYAGYIGGAGGDRGSSIAVDPDSNAYVTGSTFSHQSSFPDGDGFGSLTGPDMSYNGSSDAFVVKVKSDGSGLEYASYIGGSGYDSGAGIAVDTAGDAYVAGSTDSGETSFPDGDGFGTLLGPDTTYNGGTWDAFVVKVGAAAGLSISHMEVTQATQNEGNGVPLIASKPTFVRVYVHCGGACTGTPNVTGVLRGYGALGRLSDSPRSPVKPSITVLSESWQSQRPHLDKTLNYQLPLEWASGTVTLTAEISGTFSSEIVTFKQASDVEIIFQPVRLDGLEPTTRVYTATHWARSVWPIARINEVYWPTMEWRPSHWCLLKGLLDIQCAKKELKIDLTRLIQGADEEGYIFGWLSENADVGVGGSSDPAWYGGAGRAAFGLDHPTEGPKVFAHEMGHMLYRRHTNTVDNRKYSPTCTLNTDPIQDWYVDKGGTAQQWEAYVDLDSDWFMHPDPPDPPPFGDSRIQEYGVDFSRGGQALASAVVKNRDTTWDYMSYCGLLGTSNVWTSAWTYHQIYSYLVSVEATALASEPLAEAESYLIASGLVFTDDTALLEPVWVISTTVPADNSPVGTDYCLEAQDGLGTPLTGHCFDLAFLDYDTGQPTEVDGFNVKLPYAAGLARIVLKKGTVELAVQSVTDNSPEVTVTSPNGGESWASSGVYSITWTASDLDGDTLTYSVLYSANGTEWTPVGSTITETQIAVDSGELAGSDSALVRVLASDGVNTSSGESDASFTVGRKAPELAIISPEAGGVTLGDTSVWLEGSAYDREDGMLEGASLVWESSRDGTLGAGSLVLGSLSHGQHSIGLTATDSDAQTTTTTVQVLATFPEDVVPDCSVDIVDVMTVASRWQCQCGEECYNSLYDLDGDCDITVADIMSVAGKWGCTCGDASCAVVLGAASSTGPGQKLSTARARLDPEVSTVEPGDVFTAHLRLLGASTLGAFQLALDFDPAVLEVHDVTLGEFLGSTGRTTTLLGPEIDNSAGRVVFGGFSFGDRAGASGDGTLATITLRAQGSSSTQLELDDVQLVDTRGQPLEVTAEGAAIVGGSFLQTYLPLVTVP